jgi:hypothetical protein
MRACSQNDISMINNKLTIIPVLNYPIRLSYTIGNGVQLEMFNTKSNAHDSDAGPYQTVPIVEVREQIIPKFRIPIPDDD